ncbi:MAG TPA: ABC transporter permease subunit [Tepidisphaeraceae bacterium]|jgi:ABC-type transport system involved in multi-copper enzyme maturation permease subunit
MHISALSPFGPIFAKELRTAARRKRNYILRVGYLGALLLFLLFAYGIAKDWGPGGIAARAREQEALGWAFFICFSMFSVIAMAIIGPVLTSTAINGEHLHKTFHVLLMTPINAWQIAAGKLFSRLLSALVLLGLSLPVLALVRLLGGVEIRDLFGVILLAASTALASAALGLLLSSLIKRTYAVILLSYASLAFLYLGIPLLTQLWMQAYGQPGNRPIQADWMQWMAATNPVFCVMMKVVEPVRMLQISWYPCILTHLGLTAFFLLITGLLLRRMARREGDGAGAASTEPPAASETTDPAPSDASQPGNVSKPARKTARSRSRTIGDNPILWREIRRPLIPKLWQRIVGVICVVGLLVTCYVMLNKSKDLHRPGTHAAFAVVMDTALLLITCVLAGTAIAQEKEGDTWTLLLSSPVSARSIVWGKTMGIGVRVFWWYLVMAIHFIIFAWVGYISWTAIIITLLVMLAFNSIWIATGLYLSLRLGKVTAAVMLNLLLPVLLYGGFSLLLVTLENVFDWHRLSDQTTWYVPYFYMVEALDRMRPGTANWHLRLPGNSGSTGASDWITLVVSLCAAHILLALVLLIWTTVRFNRIVGRAPQMGEAELLKS